MTSSLRTKSLQKSNGAHDALLTSFKRRWFGDRTLASLAGELVSAGAGEKDWAAGFVREFDRFRCKTHNLDSFIRAQPWRDKP